MQKFIHNVALLASFIVLTCGLWQDWEAGFTVKRMFISYVGFFTVGSCLFLLFRTVPMGESKPLGVEKTKDSGKGSQG